MIGHGQYGDPGRNLLDSVVLTVLICYLLTILSLIILRRKRPDAERPYQALG